MPTDLLKLDLGLGLNFGYAALGVAAVVIIVALLSITGVARAIVRSPLPIAAIVAAGAAGFTGGIGALTGLAIVLVIGIVVIERSPATRDLLVRGASALADQRMARSGQVTLPRRSATPQLPTTSTPQLPAATSQRVVRWRTARSEDELKRWGFR